MPAASSRASATGVRMSWSPTTTTVGAAICGNRPGVVGTDVISVLANGTVVTITGAFQEADGYTWWPISLEDGTTGWIVADFLTP